jgi:ABC-2 type transport system permease protein
MFLHIFLFEIRYQLRQPLFIISAVIFFLLTFGAVTSDAVSIGGAVGKVQRNSPYVIMLFMSIMSVLGTFVTTAFVANAVIRDAQYDTEG